MSLLLMLLMAVQAVHGMQVSKVGRESVRPAHSLMIMTGRQFQKKLVRSAGTAGGLFIGFFRHTINDLEQHIIGFHPFRLRLEVQ